MEISARSDGRPVSRRRLLGTAALLGSATSLGSASAAASGEATTAGMATGEHIDHQGVIPFYGRHQAGIATRHQQHAIFTGFTVVAASTAPLIALLQQWTAAADRLTRGLTPTRRPTAAPGSPDDSGEADGLPPKELTITVGFGHSLFDDRFGLAALRPPALVDLPAFKGDALNEHWSGGDLLVQVCGDDQQVVSHAARAMRSHVMGVAELKWTQYGFLNAPTRKTPRNLLGQKDGTANPHPGTREFDKNVWARRADGPDWMTNGTYLAFRKIQMLLPSWDRTSATAQDAALGRRREDGAPLSGGGEFTPLNLRKTGRDGKPLIPLDAHVRLAQPFPMYRRSFNYDYGTLTGATESEPGEDHAHTFDAGVLFAAFVRDPRTQFVPAQRALSANDRLHDFLTHTGSALFAIPGGATPSRYLGQSLFEA